MKIKLKQKQNLYQKLVEQYGIPETDRWGIKTFEFSPEGYQFVIEAKTKKPILRNKTKYMGQQEGMHFYREKGKSMSLTSAYHPSVWEEKE